MKNYRKAVILPHNYQPKTVRQQLLDWRLPKKIQHFLRSEEQITVNGQYRSFHRLLLANDVVRLNFNHLEDYPIPHYLADNSPVTIAFENSDFIIFNKPAGQKTHPNSPIENGSLLNAATAYLAPNQRPHIVHRLDEATNGLILVAKNPIVAAIFNRQLTTKTMQRDYLAVVGGTDLPKSGVIELPIGIDPLVPHKRCIDYQTGLNAKTTFKVLATHQDRTLLQLQLATGRTHQLRVHLAAIGHPILGDALYRQKNTPPATRLLLQATRLELILPFTTEKLIVQLPSPGFNHCPAAVGENDSIF